MFLALLLPVVAWMALRTALRGPRQGLWEGWTVALLLLPVWVVVRLGTFTLDLRTAAAAAGLTGLWLARRGLPGGRLRPADVLVLLLAGVQVVSETQAAGFNPVFVAEAARRWLVPYLVGRWFLGRVEDVERVLPAFCWAALAASLYAIAEALSHVNPANQLFGRVYGLLEEGSGYRWGLKRAQVFLDHPIYFGCLLVLLLPWVVEARRQAAEGKGPAWWRWVPAAVLAALLCTGSRAALLAALASAGAAVFFGMPRWRIPLAVLAVTAAGCLLLFRDLALEGLSQLAGGPQNDDPVPLMVRGEEVRYTGTNHRVLLFLAYEEELARLGPFGFGTDLAGIDMDEIPSRFRSIDNHFLLLLLQHGWAALALFLLLAAVSLVNLARIAWHPGRPAARLAALQFGSLAGVTLMLGSVWFAPDFGAAWLFAAGLSTNLTAVLRPAPAPCAALDLVAPRLVPAHAPVRYP